MVALYLTTTRSRRFDTQLLTEPVRSKQSGLQLSDEIAGARLRHECVSTPWLPGSVQTRWLADYQVRSGQVLIFDGGQTM